MPSTYKFTPLYGANNDGPMCSILQIDSIYILLDCGWDDRLEPFMLSPIEEYAPKINAVLVSHADFTHIGGLPYIYAQWNCQAPIYINTDAVNIARFCLEDAYENRLEGEEKCLFSKYDIDKVCGFFRPIVYNQREIIDGSTVYVNARESGHTVCGCIWDIQTETDNLVYSMNINPLSDKHLREASYKPSGNVSILITDTCQDIKAVHNGQYENSQYSSINYYITDTLRDKRGSVLIPVESTGRCLEVILILEQMWKKNSLDGYKVYFLTKRNAQFITHVRGIVSNLNEKLQQAEQEAFDLQYVSCVPNIESVLDNQKPKVVLISMAGLETSFSQDLFKRWCEKEENLLLFVTTPPPGTLADAILNAPDQKQFTFTNRRRIPLQGEALIKRIQEIEQQRQQQKEQKKAVLTNQDLFSKLDAEKMEVEDEDEIDDAVAVVKQPLFAYVDDDVEFDEFGIKPRKEYEPILVRDDDDDEEDGMDDSYYKQEEKIDYFNYEVVENDTITVNMRRKQVDYNGLSDYATLHSIIREINPSQIICWHGRREKRDCVVENLMKDKTYVIHTAENQQTIEVVSRHNVAKIRLDDDLLNSLHHYMIGDYEVARACGCVEVIQEPTSKEGEDQYILTRSTSGKITMPPVALRTEPLGIRKVYELLENNNIDVVMDRDRIEVMDRDIIIRNDNDVLVVEGNASVNFQRIQQLLTEQYNIV